MDVLPYTHSYKAALRHMDVFELGNYNNGSTYKLKAPLTRTESYILLLSYVRCFQS